MIYKIAEFTINPSKLEEAKQIIKEFIQAIKDHEPDVMKYESFQEQGGSRFFHLMSFKDRKAESGHQQAVHTQKFVKVLHLLCEKEPVFSTLEVVEIK